MGLDSATMKFLEQMGEGEGTPLHESTPAEVRGPRSTCHVESCFFGHRCYDGQSVSGNILDKIQWNEAPVLGQNSKGVLIDLLGYSETDLDALASDAVTSSI